MPLRVVQLTDLHLTAGRRGRIRGTDVWDNLHRVLGHVREVLEPVDLLVLTGDLANRPRPGIYRQLRAELEPWEGRLRVLPGNHDRRQQVREAFADLFVPGLPDCSFRAKLGGWTLLGLDSLRTLRPSGRLGPRQLGWLAGELRAAPGPVLVFVHHPPVRLGTWWLDKDRLRDHRQLGALLQGGKVRGTFCGHVHQEHEVAFAGVPAWTTPSTAYQFRPGDLLPRTHSRDGALRVIETEGETLRTHVVRLPAAQ